jgi:hypothetical protein
MRISVRFGDGVGLAFGAVFVQLTLGIALGAGIVIGSVLAARGHGRPSDPHDPDA